jgi:frataxin-like iron-binding protein CyaY
MSNKSFELYEHVFQYIKYLLDKFNINIDWKEKYVMMDFEKASRKAFNKTFPEAHLWGCYFHYAKALWKNAKKQGLVKKDLKLDTFILIFALKLYQFIVKMKKKII